MFQVREPRVAALAALALALALGPELCCAAAGGGSFRGARGGRDGATGATVAARSVEASLQASLEAAVDAGGGAAARQLARIEEGMWHTFQALPKNSMGRLAPRSVRHLVHGYFAKEHGWLIKGLEPHGMQLNMTEVHNVSILQDKAPALVEALLEARHSGHGLSLGDVVAMAAALEKLIFEESIMLLKAAYMLNGQSAEAAIDETVLHDVLTSYLLVFEMGIRGNLSDIRKHQAIKRKVAAAGGSWLTLVEFEQDAVGNFEFAHRDLVNPFVPPEYSFEAASRIVEDLAGGYGKWQNTECRQMKEELMGLDPDGSGLVPLKAFYSQPETADYQFTESADYLSQIGALDESETGKPRVRIANYMTGPSNCIASSSYYSVCCLSDCEGLMNELESKVSAPTASPEQLLGLVANLSTSSDERRELPQALSEKLHSIADRHDGAVLLHGRLFAQWMHFAFPSECPYPHIAEDPAVLTPGHWLNRTATASREVRQQHIEAASQAVEDAKMQSALRWSDDEILPLEEPQSRRSGALGSAVRVVMQVLLLLVLLRTLFAGLRTAARTSGVFIGKGKDENSVLPLYC